MTPRVFYLITGLLALAMLALGTWAHVITRGDLGTDLSAALICFLAGAIVARMRVKP